MDKETLYTLTEHFIEYCNKNHVFVQLYNYDPNLIGVVRFKITWGDWKHSHLAFKCLFQKYFKERGYNPLYISQDVTEEDGSDTYSAIHRVYIN